MNIRSKPTLSGTFESGLLFGKIDDNMVLLQVYSDYDFARRSLSQVLGRGMAEFAQGVEATGTAWIVDSEKKHTYVVQNHFRPYRDTLDSPPMINKLLLVPFTLDRPIIANDFMERKQ